MQPRCLATSDAIYRPTVARASRNRGVTALRDDLEVWIHSEGKHMERVPARSPVHQWTRKK